VGILARSAEAASGLTFLISFLPYPSSAFVPTDTLPSWLRGFADNQPATPVIDSMRALLSGQPVGSSAWAAAPWSLGIAAFAVFVAGVLFGRGMRCPASRCFDTRMLLEREELLASLTARRAEAAAGTGRLVFVGGEAGVGKTMLIAEFSRDGDSAIRVLR